MHNYQIKANRFLLWWVIGSIMVYPMAVILGGILMVPVGMVANFMRPTSYYYYNTSYHSTLPDFFFGVAVVILLGGVIGFCVGQIQRNLLRRYLYWTADNWRRHSVMGGMGGAILAMMVSNLLPNSAGDWKFLVMMPVYVLCLSIAQWMTLRHATRSAGLWIFANVIGGVVFSGVLVMNQPDYYSRSYNTVMFFLFGLAVFAQAVITGIMMLWLFEKYAYPPEPELEPVPAPIEKTPPNPNRKPSVWDDAI